MQEQARAGGVAVIVVHGVADQRPGDTARAVVDLLVAAAPAGVAYAGRDSESFVLDVAPLAPHVQTARAAPPTPDAKNRPLAKALAQSARSDFVRAGWEAAPGTAKGGRAPHGRLDDAGLAATDYLLAKFRDNGAGHEAYESARIGLERRDAAGGRERVDVYEMYWADLSRLSGAIPRIVTELFTMVFRLSKLGRDTVDAARLQLGAQALRWRALAWTQIALDWAFVNGLGALFAQLGLLGLAIVAFGVAWPHAAAVTRAMAIAALVLGVLLVAYRRRDPPSRRLAPGALCVIAVAMLVHAPWAVPLAAALFLLAITIGYDAALRVADERFPFTLVVGRVLWIVVLAGVVGHVVMQGRSGELVGWLQASLFGVELVLTGVKLWWVAAAPLFVAWLVAGIVACRRAGYQASASVGTGRVGFFVSLGTFVMLMMAIWAAVSGLLAMAVDGVNYLPVLFSAAEVTSGHSDAALGAAACPWFAAAAPTPLVAATAPPVTTAVLFLAARYEDTTAFFSLAAALMLSLVAYLATMFVPSVLAELKLGVADPARDPGAVRRLGRWLTGGYRRLDAIVLGVVFVAIVVAIAVGYSLVFGQGGPLGDAAASGAIACVTALSQHALEPLVLTAASIAAVLAALGGVLSRYVPGLRAPLDMALDIDNYFREFPRKSIPRARIFSRYAALLAHVAAEGYTRIVVVSHSQGTVISAELLRFLSKAAAGPRRHGGEGEGEGQSEAAGEVHASVERLRRKVGSDVRLLTLGCPLRQLYAARFPSLYGWVLAAHGAGNGPRADDIGVECWANAFTSGDYVGRWLWSSPLREGDALGLPMLDSVEPPVFGRTDAYAAFAPMPPAAQPFDSAREFEVCLGAGAHTHYFEPDQATVAWLIDHLVAAPAVPDAQPSPPETAPRDAAS